MRTVIAALLLMILVPSASAYVDSIQAPFSATVGEPCPGPLDSYVFTHEFVFPSAGVWNLRIVDRTVWSLPFPAPEDQISTIPILVGEQVAAEEATWGRVKSMYR